MLKHKSFIIVSGLLITLTLLTVAVINAAFTDPVDLATNANFPSIDVDTNGIIHAVWAVGGADRNIIYAKSTDDGLTFPVGSRIDVSATIYSSTQPWLKVGADDVIHIVWEQDSASGESEVYYANSTDGGTSFSTPLNISNDSVFSGSPYVETSSGDKIHIAWTNLTPDEEWAQIYYASSIDGGSTFSSSVNISNTTHDADNPVVRAKGSAVGVIWQAGGPDYGIYRVLSTDNGDNFGAALNIAGNTTIRTLDPVIGIDGNNRVHIAAAAYNQSNPEIFYSRSTNGGVSFTAPVNLSQSADAVSERPTLLAVGNNTIYIMWAENVCNGGSCTKRMYYRKSSNGGVNFTAATSPKALEVFTAMEESDLDIYGLELYVIWEERGTVRFIKGSE